MAIFVLTVFFSSFLLFAVQPMIAKFLLPSFGGTAAVWATCLVFFQFLLLAGYAYAHLLRSRLSTRTQRWTHLGVLAVALLFMPPAPHVGALTTAAPVRELLWALVATIGVPFFALSATAPLLMEWFRQAFPGQTPDRLYAFSNSGSLLALLAYPAVLEPVFTRGMQARLWAGGMGVFWVLCAVAAWRSWRRMAARGPRPAGEPGTVGTEVRGGTEVPQRVQLTAVAAGLRHSRGPGERWLWVALPACGSGLLLALTNQISQDVAPMPLLWVAPMAVYLLTFILCFEGPRSYRRGFFLPACFAGFLVLGWLLDQGYLQGFAVQVGGYLGVLFVACMVCHGELYRLRPLPERLTAYYLAISLGGALGGIFVGLVAPAVFKTILETAVLVVAVAGIATFILWNGQGLESTAVPSPSPPPSPLARGKTQRPVRGHGIGQVHSNTGFHWGAAALLGTLVIAAALAYVIFDVRSGSVYFTRSFYGAYRVKQGPTLWLDGVDYPLKFGPARVLLSGQIYHGLQFQAPEAASVPTTYYSEEGGLGLAFRALPVKTNRNIGAIGLGTGTLAAYGQPGDHIRFYELNPDVERVARTWFNFLSNSPAKLDVILGDGRLSLASEPDQHFDLLVLDAFAGDSIPMHLLTEEAMNIYRRHLNPDGVMAFHISNSHLDLDPVVRALAGTCGMTAALVPAKYMDPREGNLASIWMLVSANRHFFQQPGVANLSTEMPDGRQPLLWTDDYSSILPILH